MSILRITQLEMHQIGPFGDLTLTFPEKPAGMEDKAEIHILTGENGTGKSTVLEMLALGLAGKGEVPPNFNYKWRFNTEKPFISLAMNKGGIDKKEGNKGRIHHISFNSALTNAYWEPYHNFPHDEFETAFFAYSGHQKLGHFVIDGIREIPTNPFHGALNFQESKQPERILQWIANTITARALAESDGNTQEVDKRSIALKKTEDTIGSIIQKSIKFKLDTNPYFEVVFEMDGARLSFNHLPDGLKSLVSWLGDLLMRLNKVPWKNNLPVFERNFILFLDEIEIHMHPAWQRKVLPVVQRLFPNAQIFISTHSPFVVGSVDGAWIHKLVKPNGDSKLAEGYPIVSEDGNSFRYWLDEVFDVSAEFGIDAENQLKQFYILRDEILKGTDESAWKKWLEMGRALAEQSPELHQIIEMELRQVNRRKSLSLSI